MLLVLSKQTERSSSCKVHHGRSIYYSNSFCNHYPSFFFSAISTKDDKEDIERRQFVLIMKQQKESDIRETDPRQPQYLKQSKFTWDNIMMIIVSMTAHDYILIVSFILRTDKNNRFTIHFQLLWILFYNPFNGLFQLFIIHLLQF